MVGSAIVTVPTLDTFKNWALVNVPTSKSSCPSEWNMDGGRSSMCLSKVSLSLGGGDAMDENGRVAAESPGLHIVCSGVGEKESDRRETTSWKSKIDDKG